MNTYQKLEKMAELSDYLSTYEASKVDKKSVLEMQMNTLIDSVLTPEIMAKVNEIKEEFQPMFDALDNDLDYLENKSEYEALEAEVKQEVIEAGQTIKGSCLQACYAKGRVSWDTKMLDGYVVAHPEVEQFRKVGEPSVSIRKVAQ